MNLLCPSCQKMLQVEERYAGQQMRCPLCNNVFTVPPLPESPALAPPPPPPPPESPDPVYSFADDPSPPPPLPLEPQEAEPVDDPTKRPYAPPPRPPAPAGDYTRTKSIVISPRCVPWVAPVALLALFVLSFLPWSGTGGHSVSAWGMGFGDDGHALFVFYDLLLIFAVMAAVASLLMHLRVIPDVPQLRPLQPWRGAIVAILAGLGLLLFFLFELFKTFELGGLPLSFWGLLAFWIHVLAVIGALLESWLLLRGPTRPPPRIDIHW